MTEQKTGLRRMGQERWKYMDMANLSFAAGEYLNAKGYIDAFLETVEEGSEAAKEITVLFDEIDIERTKARQSLEDQKKEWGELEKADIGNKAILQIEINAIYERKAACWTMALKHGLFKA